MSVDLIDPAPAPREKACGDLLSSESVRHLHALGLDHIVALGRSIGGMCCFNSDGVCTRKDDAESSDFGPIAIPRARLDWALRSAAVHAGTRVIEGRCVALNQHPADWSELAIAHADGDIVLRSYQQVIGADGARTLIGRAVGLRPRSSFDHALSIRRYVDVSEPLPSHPLFFEEDLSDVECGPYYEWAFPTDNNTLNVGVYSCGPVLGRLASHLSRFETRLQHHFGATQTFGSRSKVLGGLVRYDFDPRHISIPGALVIGDAAGLSHATLGEGILYAIRSGACAAQIILENENPYEVARIISEQFDSEFTLAIREFRRAAHERISIFN